jgi:hypothetical protein
VLPYGFHAKMAMEKVKAHFKARQAACDAPLFFSK